MSFSCYGEPKSSPLQVEWNGSQLSDKVIICSALSLERRNNPIFYLNRSHNVSEQPSHCPILIVNLLREDFKEVFQLEEVGVNAKDKSLKYHKHSKQIV